MPNAIPNVELFAARLREQAGATRRMLVRVVDGKPSDFKQLQLDGYVMLTPEEAIEVAELIESAAAIVAELGS